MSSWGEYPWGYNGWGGVGKLVPLDGWGSQGWGVSPWGAGSISVQGTGAVGTVGISVSVTFVPTGVSATGAVGTTLPQVNFTLTGVVANGSVGDVRATVVYTPTGVQGLSLIHI